MSLDFLLDFGLAFFDWIFMIFLDIFVFLKNLSNLLRSFALAFLIEFVKVGVFFNQMRMVFNCIHDNMEQSNGTTGIFGILFHKKEIGRYFVIF